MQIITFEPFQGAMANIKTRIAEAEIAKRAFNDNGGRGQRSISASLWTLIRAISGENPAMKVGIGYNIKGGIGWAELKRPSESKTHVCLIKQGKTGIDVYAAEVDENSNYFKYDATSRKGTVVTAAYIAYLITVNPDVLFYLKDLDEYVKYDENNVVWSDPLLCEKFRQSLQLISSAVYYGQINDNIVTIKQLRQNQCPKILPSKIGTLTIVEQQVNKAIASASKIEVGKYSIRSRNLSDEEKNLIPVFPEGFTVPGWVENTVKRIKNSSSFTEPFRNILLTGPAGTGKTTGAMMIATLLGLPYLKETCDPDTDMFKLIGQLLPNTEDGNIDPSAVVTAAGLPTFDDIENDPQGAFKKLFGREMTQFDTTGEMYAELFKKTVSVMEKSKDFTYVESNFVRAIKNGWVIELQEPNVIKRKSVLVGLNGIMENNANVANITLPTGKTIQRHKDAVVVITTNGDYDGCSTLQQSVLSRCQIVKQIGAPTVDDLTVRTKNATKGDKSLPMLSDVQYKTMADVILNITEYSAMNDITDGVCGPRELQNWAKEAIMLQVEENESNPAFSSVTVTDDNVIRAAFETVIAKASQEKEGRDEIITAIFCKIFNRSKVEDYQIQFESGDL